MIQRVLNGATIAVAAVALFFTGSAGVQQLGEWWATRDRVIEEWRSYATAGNREGPSSAPVTIVEWVDYQCPACRTMASRIDAVLRTYTGQVSVVYRHWPMPYHPHAASAAQAVECAAEQGAFPEMHSFLMGTRGWYDDATRAVLDFVRSRSRLDESRFVSCFSGPPSPAIARDTAAVARLGGRGTPTLLINGVYPGTLPDSSRLDRYVRDALAAAGAG
jgi:protein-disulfide isomerase